MKIQIKNYNCIHSLDYCIQNGKINFLVGMNGSGKSSIAKSLTLDDTNDHVPYYNSELQSIVLVDGETLNKPMCCVYDDDYMRNVLIKKEEKSDIYSILVGNEGKVENIKSEYQKSIAPLNAVKDELFEIKRNIETLKNDLKINYKQDGTYSKNCLIQTMINDVDKQGNSYLKYKNYDSKRIKWLSDGTKYTEYNEGKCPFCNRKLSSKRKYLISQLLIFDSKTYEKINSKNNIFNALNLVQPNWQKKREVSAFNNQLKNLIGLQAEIESGIAYIIAAEDTDAVFKQGIMKLKISNNLKKTYPEIANAFAVFNSKYSSIRKNLGKIKEETDNLIGHNLKKINDYLELLGIKYKFNKLSIDDGTKQANFYISHVKEINSSIDRVPGLSYGEKNLVGLVLFLLAHQLDNFIIIDDPASSFDEYRRKVLFNMLYDMKSPKTTLLVMSHDTLFAKFAVLRLKKQNIDTYTGNIDFLESYDTEKIIPIMENDFAALPVFIEKRIAEIPHNIMNYQLAANLRLLYEVNKQTHHEVIYKYLSAIIHGVPKMEIDELLKKKGKTEDEILDAIAKSVFAEQHNFTISHLSDDYFTNFNYDELNNVEKIVRARELCKGKGSRRIKDELSSIIHLNNAYIICLNPYKFNYFSEYVKKYINEIHL